jgi:hypothetical protein
MANWVSAVVSMVTSPCGFSAMMLLPSIRTTSPPAAIFWSMTVFPSFRALIAGEDFIGGDGAVIGAFATGANEHSNLNVA